MNQITKKTIYGMQLSYSSKFRVVSGERTGHARGRFVKCDKCRVFPTSILSHSSDVNRSHAHSFRRGSAKKNILIVRGKFTFERL
jgi:uncharacterized C2H2 Zn-finger protein